MSYQVLIPGPVQKQLDALPQNARVRVLNRLAALNDDPRPHGSIKLKGSTNEYRIRIGDYRVRYEVRDQDAHDHRAPLQASEGRIQTLTQTWGRAGQQPARHRGLRHVRASNEL